MCILALNPYIIRVFFGCFLKNNKIKKVVPDIKTKRLQLRALEDNDIKDLFEVRFHDDVIKYISREKPKNETSIKQFISDRNVDCKNGKIVFWAIQKRNEEKLIGTISLWNFNDGKTVAEVGYELHPDEHRKGYMSEALQAVLVHGFNTLKLDAIEAFTNKNNRSSQKLLEKFKFKYDANRIDQGFPDNKIYIKAND